MKISISCSGGTARILHLAAQLDRQDVLFRLYVHLYGKKNRLAKLIFGSLMDEDQVIDTDKVETDIGFNIFYRFISATRLDKLLGLNTRIIYGTIIDRNVAKKMRGGADIMIAEANFALKTLKRAKELGMIAILDRTNTHIRFQSQILKEEYEKLGIQYVFNDDAIITRALDEYEEADYISVLSSFVKDTFLRNGVAEEKLIVTPSGVDVNYFKPREKTDRTFRVITSGCLCVKKGIHYLLEAFRGLNLKDAELWLIGNAFEDIKPILSRYKGVYRFFGFVPHKRLCDLFSQGSVFVLPSLEEGLAKVLMEAMACGLPVIATPNTGASDVIRNGVDGFIVPVRDAETIRIKLAYLYENPGVREEMGRRARERVCENFTWEAYLHRLTKEYKRLMEHHNDMGSKTLL